MIKDYSTKEKQLMPLLEELASLKDFRNRKPPLTRSQISLFGNPFSRTDFSDFSRRCQQFLRAVPDPPESKEEDEEEKI